MQGHCSVENPSVVSLFLQTLRHMSCFSVGKYNTLKKGKIIDSYFDLKLIILKGLREEGL